MTCKNCNLFDFAFSKTSLVGIAPRRRDGVHTMARGAASRWYCVYGAWIDVPLERCDVAVGHVGICGERDLLRAFERPTCTMARSHIAWTTEWHCMTVRLHSRMPHADQHALCHTTHHTISTMHPPSHSLTRPTPSSDLFISLHSGVLPHHRALSRRGVWCGHIDQRSHWVD